MTARFTRKDWEAVRQAQTLRLLSEKWPTRRRIQVLLIILAGAGLGHAIGNLVPVYAMFLGGLAGVLSQQLGIRATVKRMAPDEGGLFLTEHHLEFSDRGFRSTQSGMSTFTDWSAVRALAASDEHVSLWLDRQHCQTIPLRFLPEGITPDEFKSRIEHWTGRTFEAGTAALEAVRVRESPNAWLHAVGRLLLLRPATIPAAADARIIPSSGAGQSGSLDRLRLAARSAGSAVLSLWHR